MLPAIAGPWADRSASASTPARLPIRTTIRSTRLAPAAAARSSTCCRRASIRLHSCIRGLQPVLQQLPGGGKLAAQGR